MHFGKTQKEKKENLRLPTFTTISHSINYQAHNVAKACLRSGIKIEVFYYDVLFSIFDE